jgi:hypothetical protein
MMYVPSTDDRGAALLTWFLEVSLAKTSPRQGRELDSQESEAVSGGSSLASFAKYDPSSCSWKTPQCSLLEESTKFSGTWPKWGTMQNGACYPQKTLELPTCESAFGSLLPTPTASTYGTRNNGHRSDGTEYKTKGAPSLETMARKALWPTPTCGDAYSSGSRNTPTSKAHPGISLTDAVRGDGGAGRERLPTPAARDYLSPNATKERKDGHNGFMGQLPNVVGGQLNPTWVEWLMGWPLGWTACEPLETDKFQQWLDLHGKR